MHAPLGDLEAPVLRQPAQPDVVGLGAGEVVQRGGEVLVRQHAQVDLEVVLATAARSTSTRPVPITCATPGALHEGVEHRLRRPARRR